MKLCVTDENLPPVMMSISHALFVVIFKNQQSLISFVHIIWSKVKLFYENDMCMIDIMANNYSKR